jgi:hypothetical protein
METATQMTPCKKQRLHTTTPIACKEYVEKFVTFDEDTCENGDDTVSDSDHDDGDDTVSDSDHDDGDGSDTEEDEVKDNDTEDDDKSLSGTETECYYETEA